MPIAPSLVRHRRRDLIAGAVLAASLLDVSLAAAAPDCARGYQVIKGTEIETPYCQDIYLTEVARSYGLKTTLAEIRDKPIVRREVCNFIGRDIRIAHLCPSESGRGR